MYQYFHKLRVRFAELEMKQGEVAKRANMAESTLTARMTGRLPWNGDEIARVAKVLDIPADQIGAFFFVDAPKEYKKKDLLTIKRGFNICPLSSLPNLPRRLMSFSKQKAKSVC